MWSGDLSRDRERIGIVTERPDLSDENSNLDVGRPTLPLGNYIEQNEGFVSDADISGRFLAGDGSCEMIIEGGDFIYNVVALYGYDEGHPASFPVDLRHPFFDWNKNKYRFDYEGKDGDPVDRVYLVWGDLKLKGYHSQIVLHKQ